MPLTRDYRESLYEQLKERPGFRRALLGEAMNCMLEGDFSAGKSVLRNFVNGTIGFPRLAAEMKRSPKSLMRMLSREGNPQAKNLFELIVVLQRHEGVKLELKRVKKAA